MKEALNALTKILEDALESEKYNGVSVSSVLDMVDLEIGFELDNQGRPTFLRVVRHNVSESYEHSPPEVSKVEMNGSRYMIRDAANHDFEFLYEATVKVMRARFLLINNAYYPRLRSMSPRMRDQVVADFFGGSVWIPPEGGTLSKAMGFEE